MKENETYMDSIEGHLKQLESAWQEFAINTLESDTVKGFIDAGKAALDFIEKIGGFPTILSTIVTLFAMSKVPKGVENLSKLQKSFSSLSTWLERTKQVSDRAGKSILTVGIHSLSTAQKMAVLSSAIMVGIGVFSTLYTASVAYKNHLEQLREENISAANEASEAIKKRQDEKKAIEDTVSKLQEEKKAKEDLNGTNKATISVIDNEIKKRQENIDKMQEEIDKNKTLLKSKLSSLEDTSKRRLTENRYFGSGFFDAIATNFTIPSKLSSEENQKLTQSMLGNVATYRKELEALLVIYQKKKDAEEEGSSASKKYQKTIDTLNKEMEKTESVYKDNKKVAQTYYDALYKGGLSATDLTKEQKQMIKDYLNLNDAMIEQASKGVDTQQLQIQTGIDYSKMTNDNQAALQSLNQTISDNLKLNDEQKSALESWSNAQLAGQKTTEDYNNTITGLTNNIDAFVKALKEQTDNGKISDQTLAELLATNQDYADYITYENGEVQLNADAFQLLTQAKYEEIKATLEAQKTDLQSKLDNERVAVDNLSGSYERLSYSKTLANNFVTSLGGNTFPKKNFNEKLAESGVKGYVSDTEAQLNSVNDSLSRLDDMWKKVGERIKTSSKRPSGSGGRTPSSKSKSKSKSTKEEYKATIDVLYNYTNALNEAKDQVDQLQDSLDSTENYEEQERYINELIVALNNQIDKTKDLKNAQSNQINDYINQLRAQGFAIDYNAEKNQLYIQNMQHLADFSGDTAKSLEKMISKIQELNENNRTLDGSVRDLTKSTKDYYKQLADLPEEKLNKFNELMKEFQQSQLNQVQNQIDDLENALKNDTRIKALEKQIEALENQNDQLDRQKELEEKILAVEEAKEKLANSELQRNVRLYTKDKGWIWTADLDTIKDAQDELKDAQNDLQDKIKQDEIDRLKEEKEQIEQSYQNRIDALNDFLDNQNYLIDKSNREAIETFDELRSKLAEFGLDNAQYLGQATDWLNKYNEALARLNTNLGSMGVSNSGNGVLYNSALKDRINNALSSIIPSISYPYMKGTQYDKLASVTENPTVYISNISLPNVKDSSDFIEALKDLPRLASTQSSKRK